MVFGKFEFSADAPEVDGLVGMFELLGPCVSTGTVAVTVKVGSTTVASVNTGFGATLEV
jgi:hypothetical protein